jgi:hypothetical protein
MQNQMYNQLLQAVFGSGAAHNHRYGSATGWRRRPGCKTSVEAAANACATASQRLNRRALYRQAGSRPRRRCGARRRCGVSASRQRRQPRTFWRRCCLTSMPCVKCARRPAAHHRVMPPPARQHVLILVGYARRASSSAERHRGNQEARSFESPERCSAGEGAIMRLRVSARRAPRVMCRRICTAEGGK